jgi:dTDP-4-amino-4,6-dideoxy-D-galactose acyltransferase
MTASNHIKALPWESAFFAKQLGMLETSATRDDLVLSDLASFDLVEARVPTSHLGTVDRLLEKGFKFVETEVAYTYEIGHPDEGTDFRVATSEDLHAVQALAQEAFQFSRFRPPWFAASDSARLYGVWAENAILGTFDDQCLVIEKYGRLLGFVTTRDDGNSSGRVGLIASSAGCRGKGIGTRLVRASVSWCASRGIQHLRVVTQLSNTCAMRLYERTGALVNEAAYWLYWSKNAS